MKKKIGLLILIVILLVIGVVGLGIYYSNNYIVVNYKLAVSANDYVAHALGGIDDTAYTNSLEALENSYKVGFKFYEADVKLTSDDKLVLVHGWSQKDYEERLGLEYNDAQPVMAYNSYMATKIKDKYTTLSFKDLVDFIKKHNDIYVMIDLGSKSYDETKKIYERIVEECENDDKILQRLVVGGQTTSMIEAVKDTYDFKLINLYWASDDKREKQVYSKKDFVSYCKKNNITSLSVSISNYSNSFARYMKKNGIIIYVFTENDKKEAENILKIADLVGTDYINLK